MELNENLLEYVKQEVKSLDFGKIIIEVNKTSDKIDIITEKRQRFEKETQKSIENFKKITHYE
jgi:hypothetical protein